MTNISTNRRSLLATLGLALGAGALGTREALAQFGPDQFRVMELMTGEFAIQTSRLAQQQSRNPEILNFAQLEINEQTSVAAALGAAPGTVPPRSDQVAIIQRLASTPPGPAFDRAYVLGQIAGHQEALQLNSNYAQNGFDDVGRRVAIVAVPSIQTHLSILSRLRRVV